MNLMFWQFRWTLLEFGWLPFHFCYQSDVVAKIKAEASLLRVTNEDLCKQVEGLQISRLNEVEELAYLRWVNSCLRNELKNTCSALDSDKPSSPHTVVSSNGDSLSSFSDQANRYLNCGSANRFNMMKKPKKWPITSQVECQGSLIEKDWIESDVAGGSPRRRHSISGSNYSEEEVVLSKRRQSDCFVCSKEIEKESVSLSVQQPGLEIVQRPQYFGNCQEANKLLVSSDVEKRALRIPNPPPRPSCSTSSKTKQESSAQVLPPPPPPPPPPPMNFSSRSNTATVKRAPQVVELYHSLMKRDSRKDSSNGGHPDAPDVADVRSSMIGEIENRSSHLLAVSSFPHSAHKFILLSWNLFHIVCMMF